jgi:hypothetical protein
MMLIETEGKQHVDTVRIKLVLSSHRDRHSQKDYFCWKQQFKNLFKS